jgi:hypothetical protein
MKPHPGHPILRTTVKWGGAGVTVILLGLWIASGFGLGCIVPIFPGEAGLWCGRVFVATRRDALSQFIYWPTFKAGHFAMGWGCAFMFGSAKGTAVFVPLWAPACASFIACAAAWRRDARARRRARINHCPRCGYDRAGIGAAARCPECGSRSIAL